MRKLSTWVLILMLVVAMAFGAAAAETQNNDQALAQIVETGVYYSDLSDAMQAATDGQTVRLLKDAEEVILTVKEHTTLDLNGCTLTVTYASVFGYMEDNSAANTGVLKVAEKKLLINSKNSQLPVKTENGYQFVEVLGFHTVWANENTFVFQPLFEKAGNELLKSGVANTGVSIQVEVTWKPAVGSEDLDSRTFKYGGTLINQYFNSYNAETGKYGKMFTLTLVNPDNFVDLVCYSKVVSTARVAFTPDQNNSDGHVWTDATCTAPKTCSVCGATEGEALGHTEETVAGKAATCTEDGLTEGKKCTVCGVTTVEQTVIDAKGHTEETVAGKAATCTEDGLTDGKKCTVCGVTTVEQTVIEAKGHTEETVAGKAATCTETGLTEGKKCTVCGTTTVEQEKIDALGHKEETVAGKAATCTATGLTDGKKCSVCGTTTVEQTVIDAKGHTFVDGTCENCGEPDPDAGNEGVVSTLVTFEFGDNGAAKHEDGKDLGTTKSYTEDKWTLTLTSMSKVFGDAYDAKGNSCIKLGTSKVVGGFSFTVPADVTEVVIYVAKYKTSTTKITVNGTTYTISGASDNGIYDAITVDTTSTKTVTLTTVSSSYRAMVNAIEFKGINNCTHANIEDVTAKAATCTQSGNTAGTKCADCGAIMTGCEEIEATGHNWVDATCQAPKTCSACEATDGVVADHNYVDGACTVCGTEEPSETQEVIVAFNLGAKGSASHNDGTSKTTYTETVDGYKLSITSGTSMYTGARDAKGNSCIKLGTSKVVGGFSFTVPNDVTSVKIYIAKYKSNTTKINVNGTAYTLTKNSNDGAYDVIVVDTSVTKTVTVTTVSGGIRAMVNTIEFVIPGKN